MLERKKLKEASLNNAAYAFSQVNKALALERGQPTEIKSFHEVSVNISQIDIQIRKLESEIKMMEDTSQDVFDITEDMEASC